MIVADVLLGVLGAGALWLATGVRVVQQVERGVVFRFGRVRRAIRQPGIDYHEVDVGMLVC